MDSEAQTVGTGSRAGARGTGPLLLGSWTRQAQKEVDHTKKARRPQGEPNATF